MGLLSIIKNSTIQKVTIHGKYQSWISKLWSSDHREDIVNKYQNNGFDIIYIDNQDVDPWKHVEECFVVSIERKWVFVLCWVCNFGCLFC